MLLKSLLALNNRNLNRGNVNSLIGQCVRNVAYVQGQEPVPNLREYFYYIDHEGMLFLDDAKMKNFTSCFKEKTFLKFFFSRLRLNNTERYRKEFPYLSLCGRERNYIRCDDTPIVYTHVLQDAKGDKLSYAYGGELLTVDFQPQKIYMNPATGRVYHPAWEKVGGIGLIRSKLAIELSRNFEFDQGEQVPPTHFTWHNERLQLENNWVAQTHRYGMFEQSQLN